MLLRNIKTGIDKLVGVIDDSETIAATLVGAGIKKIEDLCLCQKADLMDMPELDINDITKIEDELTKVKLSLGMSQFQLDDYDMFYWNRCGGFY